MNKRSVQVSLVFVLLDVTSCVSAQQGLGRIQECTRLETRKLDRMINWSTVGKECPFGEPTVLHLPVVYVDTPQTKAAYLDGSFTAQLAIDSRWKGWWRNRQLHFESLIYDENDSLIGTVEYGVEFPRCRNRNWLNADNQRLIQLVRDGASDVMVISLGRGISFIYRIWGDWWVLGLDHGALCEERLGSYVEANWTWMVRGGDAQMGP